MHDPRIRICGRAVAHGPDNPATGQERRLNRLNPAANFITLKFAALNNIQDLADARKIQ
jgi:hypothetical protein